MSRSALVACCIVASVMAVSCITAPEVTQGSVVSYDDSGAVLVVRDERPPNEELAFSVAGAEVGAALEPGDEVRVAWVREGDTLRATRVMNLTRQGELAKKPPAGSTH